MWLLKGKYSGEAKAYGKRKLKKQLTITSIILSFFVAIIFLSMAFILENGESYIVVFLCSGLGTIICLNLILLICYRWNPNVVIKINKECFEVYNGYINASIPLYCLKAIERVNDFYVIRCNGLTAFVLQKELLVEGSWDELKKILKKIEKKLKARELIYQIIEPKTEFFEAVAIKKRLYHNLSNNVFSLVPVKKFEYYITFRFSDKREVEFEVSKQWHEQIEEGKKGTLVTIDGGFSSFEEG